MTDDTSPPRPAGDRAIPSSIGGHATESFAAQFERYTHGLGKPLQLLLYVDNMHGDCIATSIRELARVAGVREIRWINRPDHPPRILPDEVRATLARFPVRVIPANADNDRPDPMVVLYDPWTQTAMMRGGADFSQADLVLADLVDHALVHARQHADDGGNTPEQLADTLPALRCSACGRIAGLGKGSADDEPGQACGGAEHGQEPCAGVLEDVAIIVSPPVAGRPVVHAVRRTDLGVATAGIVDTLWVSAERARRRAARCNADVGPEHDGRYDTVAWGINR